jgi:hypothetical protein
LNGGWREKQTGQGSVENIQLETPGRKPQLELLSTLPQLNFLVRLWPIHPVILKDKREPAIMIGLKGLRDLFDFQ